MPWHPLGGMGWDVGLSGNVSILVHTAKNCDFKWENNDIQPVDAPAATGMDPYLQMWRTVLHHQHIYESKKENMSCEFCHCPFRYLQFGHLKYHPISSRIEGNIYRSPFIYSTKICFLDICGIKKEHVACYSFNPSCLTLLVFKHFTTSQENQEILSGTLT